MQIIRDPVRLAFAFLGSALLMLVFGFGITTDVEHIRYAAFDLDQTAKVAPILNNSPQLRVTSRRRRQFVQPKTL